MMAGLFLLLGITMLFAWFGRKQASLTLFFITLVLSVFWFWHHMSASLDLNF